MVTAAGQSGEFVAEQARRDAVFRSRCWCVLAAATSAAGVTGVLAASVDRTTLHPLLLLVSAASLLSLLNTSWWLMKPLVGPWHCPPEPTRLNGAVALSVVSLVSLTTAVLVNALTGGTPL
jgi:hypothetical protein